MCVRVCVCVCVCVCIVIFHTWKPRSIGERTEERHKKWAESLTTETAEIRSQDGWRGYGNGGKDSNSRSQVRSSDTQKFLRVSPSIKFHRMKKTFATHSANLFVHPCIPSISSSIHGAPYFKNHRHIIPCTNISINSHLQFLSV